ncbi:MAG: AgmX/PglI C-terminal domain-containing protein, partial [Myxococcota bacterium]|nr:AgmX/PglI C-terminal domain-containing protein [Myxococcota bacterium]
LSTADLRLADATASRLHARIDVQSDGSLMAFDTGGAGGINVNGESVEQAAMGIGDVLNFGRSDVTFLRIEEDDTEESGGSLSEVFAASREARAVQEEVERRVAKSERPDPVKAATATVAQVSAPEPTATQTVAVAPELLEMERVWVEPESVVVPGSAALEVGLLYQGQRIELAHFRNAEVRIGKELEVPVEGSRYEGRTLFARGERGWTVHIPSREVWLPAHGGGKVTKPELVPGFFRQGDSVGAPIGVNDSGSFTCGPIQLDYRLVPAARPWPTSWLSQINFDFLNLLLISLLLHAAMVILLSLHPPRVVSLEDALTKAPNRFVRLIIQPRPKKDPDAEKKKAKTKAKSKDIKKSSTEAKKIDDTPGKTKPTAADVEAGEKAIDSLFGGAAGVASEALSAGNSELSNALGSISAVDPNANLVGLTNNDAVRRANSVVALKRVNTRGRSSDRNYGKQQRNLGDKKRLKISLNSAGSKVKGNLDRKVVERVVRRHRAQIKYCYELELMRTPGLEGKLVMQWVIGPNGRVRSAKARTQGTTLANDALTRCIINKIRAWAFDKPRGGGVVVVNWPFLFKEAG